VDWNVIEARDEDLWPQTFVYADQQARSNLILIGLLDSGLLWADVLDYYYTSIKVSGITRTDLARIESRNSVIELTIGIGNRLRLERIVERFAVNARRRGWRVDKSADSLDSQKSPSSREHSNHYSYRNRTVRSLVVLLTFCTSLPVLLAACDFCLRLPVNMKAP